MPLDRRRKPRQKGSFIFPSRSFVVLFRMHYVVKSGRSAAMRGALKRKTACPNTVIAPYAAQPSSVSNDMAFFPLLHTVLSLRRCSSVASCWRSRPAIVSVSREAIPNVLRSVGWCLVVHGSPREDRRSVTCSRVNFPCSAGRGTIFAAVFSLT